MKIRNINEEDEDIINSIETALTVWDTMRQGSIFEEVVPAAWEKATAAIERHHDYVEEAREKMPLEVLMQRNDEHPQVIRHLASTVFDAVKDLDEKAFASVAEYVRQERESLDHIFDDPFGDAFKDLEA